MGMPTNPNITFFNTSKSILRCTKLPHALLIGILKKCFWFFDQKSIPLRKHALKQTSLSVKSYSQRYRNCKNATLFLIRIPPLALTTKDKYGGSKKFVKNWQP